MIEEHINSKLENIPLLGSAHQIKLFNINNKITMSRLKWAK
jgi:hypothetical protein